MLLLGYGHGYNFKPLIEVRSVYMQEEHITLDELGALKTIFNARIFAQNISIVQLQVTHVLQILRNHTF